jgi:hypothetical protein
MAPVTQGDLTDRRNVRVSAASPRDAHTGDEVPTAIQGFPSFHRQIRHRESPFPLPARTLRDSDMIPETEKSFGAKQATWRLTKERLKGFALEGWAGPASPAPSLANEMTTTDSAFRWNIRNAKPDLRRKKAAEGRGPENSKAKSRCNFSSSTESYERFGGLQLR